MFSFTVCKLTFHPPTSNKRRVTDGELSWRSSGSNENDLGIFIHLEVWPCTGVAIVENSKFNYSILALNNFTFFANGKQKFHVLMTAI